MHGKILKYVLQHQNSNTGIFLQKSTAVHGNRSYVSLKSIKSACYEIGISHDQVDVIKWENYELKMIMIENDSAAR